jgi:hypothetical protein
MVISSHDIWCEPSVVLFTSQGLVKKLYREFMIMGFISFAILLATELSTFTADVWYVFLFLSDFFNTSHS